MNSLRVPFCMCIPSLSLPECFGHTIEVLSSDHYMSILFPATSLYSSEQRKLWRWSQTEQIGFRLPSVAMEWGRIGTLAASQISHLCMEATMMDAGKSIHAKQPSRESVTQRLINPNLPPTYIPFDSEKSAPPASRLHFSS